MVPGSDGCVPDPEATEEAPRDPCPSHESPSPGPLSKLVVRSLFFYSCSKGLFCHPAAKEAREILGQVLSFPCSKHCMLSPTQDLQWSQSPAHSPRASLTSVPPAPMTPPCPRTYQEHSCHLPCTCSSLPARLCARVPWSGASASSSLQLHNDSSMSITGPSCLKLPATAMVG